MRVVSLGVCERSSVPPPLQPWASDMCPELYLPPGVIDERVHTQTLIRAHPPCRCPPASPPLAERQRPVWALPQLSGLCLPHAAPPLGAPQRDTSSSGPLTSHQLPAGTGADRGGSCGGRACTRALAHGWSSSSDTKEVACWLCPFPIQGRTYFAPEMANLCAPLPVTVPPARAPSRLRAGPRPGGRASRLPSQWGVGNGKVGGEAREGKGEGVRWSSKEGRGAVLCRLPVLLRGKPTSQLGSNFPSPWPG